MTVAELVDQLLALDMLDAEVHIDLYNLTATGVGKGTDSQNRVYIDTGQW